MLEHIHLLVQGTVKDPILENDLKKLILDIITKIDMEILGGPFVYRSDVPGNEGLTAITAITTSHITAHTWDTGLIQIDVYSCKTFKLTDITDILFNFSVEDIKTKFLDRKNGFVNIQ
jgi:S-adenosylmethionine/arginine decarboxylase-like enzyme